MKRIILMMVALFIVNSTIVSAQVSRLSIDTASDIKKVVKVQMFNSMQYKRFCIPVLHVDGKLFKGSKDKLLSFIPNNIAPQVSNDSYIAIKHGTSTSIYEKQKEGYWEELSKTHEIISEVRIIGKEVFATLKDMPVKEYKLAPVTSNHFLTHVPLVNHWDFISHW